MKEMITLYSGHKITRNALDIRLGQAVCFVGGLLMLAVSMRKLTHLELSEAQFFFGVLLSLCVPLLLFIVGMLLPVAITAWKQLPQQYHDAKHTSIICSLAPSRISGLVRDGSSPVTW